MRPMATTEISWRDVQQMPDDGRRREAVEGELYVTAAPSFRHQRICHRLAVALDRLLEAPGHGVLASAPVGVEFPATGEGVQPDLVFVSRERRGIMADDWIRGAPDLVVEVLSPSTEERDRGVKRKLYRRQGVREYWIVDPREEAVDVWRFGGKARGAADDDAAEGPEPDVLGGGEPAEPVHRRFTDRLPVRAGGDVVGDIDLEAVFSSDV